MFQKEIKATKNKAKNKQNLWATDKGQGHFNFTLFSEFKSIRYLQLKTNIFYVWGQINPRNQNLSKMSAISFK